MLHSWLSETLNFEPLTPINFQTFFAMYPTIFENFPYKPQHHKDTPSLLVKIRVTHSGGVRISLIPKCLCTLCSFPLEITLFLTRFCQSGSHYSTSSTKLSLNFKQNHFILNEILSAAKSWSRVFLWESFPFALYQNNCVRTII